MTPAAPQTAALLARAASAIRAGRTEEAQAALASAAAARPDDPAIQHDLGLACLRTGRPAEAVAAFGRAVALRPRAAASVLQLGIAHEAMGSADAAIEAYRHAGALLASLTEAHFRAGALLERLGHAGAAIDAFRRAARVAKKTTLGRIAAARVALAGGDDGAAERALRHALALDRDDPMALDLLAGLLADTGRFAEAAVCYDRATVAAPALAGSYYDLVRCRTVSAADGPLLDRLRAAATDARLPAETMARVHLALGKALDDLGDHAAAMAAFDRGSALRDGLCPYDAAGLAARVARLIERFTPEVVARVPATDPGVGPRPILIVGLPRSGTTLVEQVLTSVPGVSAGGELPFWTEQGLAWEAGGGQPGPWRAIAADYRGTLRALAPAAGWVTDKMPLNLLWLGLIHAAVPSATIVHVSRNARDTALSIHRTFFNTALAMPTGGRDLVDYIRICRLLMDHWRRVLPGGRLIEVDYDALTAAPEPAIRRLLERCDLPWDDAALHPERNARAIRTPSRWQARQPIHRGAAGAWRRYAPWLGPLGELAERPD